MASNSFQERLEAAKGYAQSPRDPELEKMLAIPTRDPSFTSMAMVTYPDAAGSVTKPGPLVVLFHPGGFFLGSPNKLITYARPLARLFGASVLCPSYRFAPEHPFPTGVQDAWDTLQWAAAHASTRLSADPERRGFLVGGISGGANFAVVLTRRAVETGLQPPITGTWAPIFMGLSANGGGDEDENRRLPSEYSGLLRSHEDQDQALVIDKVKVWIMWDYYRPKVLLLFFNFLAAPLDDLAAMPRVALQVAGHDLFRDDGLLLAHVLSDYGVELRLDVYLGVCHSFWVFAPELTLSKKFVRDVVISFAWLLDVELETLEADCYEAPFAL
ncbi:alpha/beta-hydrolase [Xylaria venustula]|nr:alpha/beta-hydrolase [Xylaria venustula]